MRRALVARLSATVLLLCMGLLPAWATSRIESHTLANGLRIFVKEDHRAPVVVSQVWYRAGSMDEHNGTTGVAHVLEHMMFKGTRQVPAGEFSRLIAAAGGRENAFTSRDYTAYFQTLQKDKLPLAFRLEADRMANLVLSEQEFAKEIEVVRNERRWRTEDKPQSLVYEALMATALEAHPYRWPVIGWMNDLINMTVADARTWYRRWYAPNNAVLVVVGDVKPHEVFRLAERYFGPLKARPLPGRKPQLEPEQTGPRRVTLKAPAKLPYLIMAWQVPVLKDPENDWEPYALEMLAGVLDANAAARFPTRLVRDSRVAVQAGASYDSIQRGPGLFLVDGTPSEGRTVHDLEAAIRAELSRIQDAGVKEEELARIRSQLIAAQVYQRDSMFYQAMQIGEVVTVGFDPSLVERRIEKLKAVTAEQIKAVARKYLVDDHLTVATLDPQPLDARQTTTPPKGLRHVD
ncbi:M16 family metallopeptidase [Thiobacter aerophilum]|uniref:Pitrilysin family protein n=1 Tax=Thiobacter aerophilum TaxID=3121275 RepID=A0ABV0EGK2_9BURK